MTLSFPKACFSDWRGVPRLTPEAIKLSGSKHQGSIVCWPLQGPGPGYLVREQ